MTREQFVKQVGQEQAALRRFLTALCCGDSAEADDIAQETLIKAYLHSSQYDERGQFAAWLMKIAYRVFIDSHRRQKSRTELPIEKALTLQGDSRSDEAFRYQETAQCPGNAFRNDADKHSALLYARLSGQRDSRNNRQQ